MFRIGDFSKIAQVSGRLLRYYDKIDLFKPAHTDDTTGYRYYTAEQLGDLNRILALKNLGLSLDQVSRLIMDNISADEIRGMLLLKKAQIEQTLQEEVLRLRQVESRLQQLDTSGKLTDTHVVLKSVPQQNYLATRYVGQVNRFYKLLNDIYHALEANTIKSSSYVLSVVHSDIFDDVDLDWELGILVDDNATNSLALRNDQHLSLRQLPAIETIATLVFIGSWDTSHLGYSELGLWVGRNGYQIAGPIRELILDINPDHRANSTIEFQFPVEKVSSF